MATKVSLRSCASIVFGSSLSISAKGLLNNNLYKS